MNEDMRHILYIFLIGDKQITYPLVKEHFGSTDLKKTFDQIHYIEKFSPNNKN